MSAYGYNGKKFVQTFDSLGNVNGGRYEDDNGMTVGYQSVKPGTPGYQAPTTPAAAFEGFRRRSLMSAFEDESHAQAVARPQDRFQQ